MNYKSCKLYFFKIQLKVDEAFISCIIYKECVSIASIKKY